MHKHTRTSLNTRLAKPQVVHCSQSRPDSHQFPAAPSYLAISQLDKSNSTYNFFLRTSHRWNIDSDHVRLISQQQLAWAYSPRILLGDQSRRFVTNTVRGSR